MKKYKNFTIIIQGPLHFNSISHIQEYNDLCNVIISAWRDDEKFNLYKQLIPSDVDVALTEPSQNLDSINNSQNRYFQIVTTLRGIKLTKTEYVIKTRSDSYFTNLIPLIEMVQNNKNKIITSNTFARFFYLYPFHLSDQLYSGKTNVLLKLLTRCKYICENEYEYKKLENYFIKQNLIKPGIDEKTKCKFASEQMMCVVYLKDILGIENLNRMTGAQHIKNHFLIIDVKKLGFYCVNSGDTYIINTDGHPNGVGEYSRIEYLTRRPIRILQ